MRVQHLFRKYDSFGVIQSRITGIKKAINELDPRRLTNEDEGDLAEKFVTDFDLDRKSVV